MMCFARSAPARRSSIVPLLAVAGLAACSGATLSEGAQQGVVVQVTPSPVSLRPSGSQLFQATVTGTANTAVTWSVREPAGGSIDGSGNYTAPVSEGTFTVVATSVADTSKSGAAVVVVSAPSPVDPSGILPADRVTRWDPGLNSVGGIPSASWPIHATLSPSGGDDTAAIQSALNSAGAVASASNPRVVKLSAGTFQTSATLNIPRSYVVLRGTPSTTGTIGGGDGTKIIPTPTQNGFTVVRAGTGSANYRQSTDLALDGIKDSRTITLASWLFSPSLEVGEIVLVDQVTDPAYNRWNPTRSPGGSGDASRGWFSRFDRPTGQVLEIESFDSNARTVTFTTPLHITFKVANRAQLARFSGTLLKYVGVEDLYIKGACIPEYPGAGQGNVWLTALSYGWIKNVETDFNNGPALLLEATFRSVIRDSFVHSTNWGFPGGAGYGIVLGWHASDNLIENNISVTQNKVFVMRTTGGGNVVAYNYFDDGYVANYMDWQEVGANASHMTTPMYELFEGNQAFNFDGDNTWGNSIYITVFRNHLPGIRRSGNAATRWSYPNNSWVDAGGAWRYGAIPLTNSSCRAAGLMEGHWWYSFVGNVLGGPGITQLRSYESTSPPWSNEAVWKLGYDPDNWNAQADPKVLSTILRDGNYDYVTGQVSWTGAAKTLPNSLYLTSKPAFFGANPWPWVDPVGATKLGTLPARARFDPAIQ